MKYSNPLSRIVLPDKRSLLSIYNLDFSNNYLSPGSYISYRETFDENVLKNITEDVRRFSNDTFNAEHAVLVTYVSISQTFGFNNTFQLVLASNGTVTFAILLYLRLDEGNAIVGYCDDFCHAQSLISTVFSQQMNLTSNIGIIGKHVLLLKKGIECSYKPFYEHSENKVSFVEVGFEEMLKKVELSRDIPILSALENSIMISLYGSLGFVKSNLQIYPYYNLLSLNNSGQAFYEESFDNELLHTLSKVVQNYDMYFKDFKGSHAFLISFYDVPLRTSTLKKQTFQIIFLTNSTNTFMIVKYVRLDAPSISITGFRDENSCTEVSYSPSIFETNTGIAGEYLFHLTEPSCQSQLFYPTESATSLQSLAFPIELDYAMPFPRRHLRRFKVYATGQITGDITGIYNIGADLNDYPEISAFSYLYDSKDFNKVNVYTSTDDTDLYKANKDIEKYEGHPFHSNQIIVVTYKFMSVRNVPMSANSFQLILASNATVTYAIMNYHRLDSVHSVVGYASTSCEWEYYINPENNRLLVFTSNIGVTGRHVIRLEDKCFKSNLYSYGHAHGDTWHEATSPEIAFVLQHPLPLFSSVTSTLYINTRSLISDYPNLPSLISLPYLQNIISLYNLKGGKGGYYIRELSDDGIIWDDVTTTVRRSRSSTEIKFTYGLVITYPEFVSVNQTNSFQLVIATDDKDTYGIFAYERLDSNYGVAGYTDATCDWTLIREQQTAYELFLRKDLTNIGEFGRYVALLSSTDCKPNKLYSYGPQFGDHIAYFSNTDEKIVLEKPLLIFGKNSTTFYLLKHGVLYVESFTSSPLDFFIKRKNFIAMYLRSNAFNVQFGGGAYFSTAFDKERFNDVTLQIIKFTGSNYVPENGLRITYAGVANYGDRYASSTFQLTVLTDYKDTYAVMNFLRVYSSDGVTGFNDPGCATESTYRKWSHAELLSNTTTGIRGEHILKIECPQESSTTTRKPTTVSTTRATSTITQATSTTTSRMISTTTTMSPITPSEILDDVTQKLNNRNTTEDRNAGSMVGGLLSKALFLAIIQIVLTII